MKIHLTFPSFKTAKPPENDLNGLIHDVLHRLLIGTTVTIRNVCKTPSVDQETTSALISPETIQKDPFMSTQLKTWRSAIRIQD
jgi:hypothetical protein